MVCRFFSIVLLLSKQPNSFAGGRGLTRLVLSGFEFDCLTWDPRYVEMELIARAISGTSGRGGGGIVGRMARSCFVFRIGIFS